MSGQQLHYDIRNLRYTGIIGTGGIGSGKFFRLNGNHSLGREESRSGQFLDIHDYCKQHIILHYVRVLLGPRFPVIPIGRVGDDDIGNDLVREMKAAGLKMDFVERVPGLSTYLFCFSYPDNSRQPHHR
jgi:ribokinase